MMEMQAYLLACERIGNDMLLLLRDGDYKLTVLNNFFFADERTMRDVLVLLKEKNLVELSANNTVIKITDMGLLHLLREARDIKHDGDGGLFREVNPAFNEVHFALPAYWKHGKDKLIQLSDELYTQKFLEDESDFVYVFDSTGITMCNWLGNHTSLLYLISLLVAYKPIRVPPSVMELVSGRFMIKGENKSMKNVQTAASNVKQFLSKTDTELRGEYLTLFEILQKIIS